MACVSSEANGGASGPASRVQQAINELSSDLPFTTLTFAQSLDGSIATREGKMIALSNSHSLSMTHHLRSKHDAIVVGVGTVAADNPRLTTRGVPNASSPIPVVIDPQLRIDAGCKLVQAASSGRRMLVIATEETCQSPQGAARTEELQQLGVTVCPCQVDSAHGGTSMAVKDILAVLSAQGIASVMVEGGASVISRFLREGSAAGETALVHSVIITICPIFVGGKHALASPLHPPEAEGDSKAVSGSLFPRLGAPLPMGGTEDEPHILQLGGDIVVHGRLLPGEAHV